MKKLLLATTLAAALSTTLLATSANAEVYVGAGLGAAQTNSNQTSGKVYLGAQFNPNLGVEIGYTDLGSYLGENVESWTAALTGTLPLDERWALLGKLGGASNRSHFPGASNHSDLYASIGVGYSMSKNVALQLEYEDYGQLSNFNTGNNDHGRNLGLSLRYAF